MRIDSQQLPLRSVAPSHEQRATDDPNVSRKTVSVVEELLVLYGMPGAIGAADKSTNG
jgi:hypothetical protein